MLDRGTAIHHDAEAPVVGDPSRFPVDHAELEPQAARPDLDRLARMGLAQLRAAEDIDELERAGRLDGLTEGGEGRYAEHRPLGRVDRDAVVALPDEVAEEAEAEDLADEV